MQSIDPPESSPDYSPIRAGLKLRRTIWLAMIVIRHLFTIRPLLFGRRGLVLRNIVWSCPELVVFCAYRYLAANWTVKTRVERVMQHCQIVEEIGWPLNVAPGKVREILRCSLVGPNYRITLDQARWLVAEGLIVISLLDGPDRLFSISANLAYLDGERVIFIGGLQGRLGWTRWIVIVRSRSSLSG